MSEPDPLARVLITGATGALGQALIRKLCAQSGLERLVVYSRSESRQAECSDRLKAHPALRWVIGDVRDGDRLTEAMGGCTSVIHTAALKRVDVMAYNPSELRKTNIEGSARVIEAAVRSSVSRVLMISSDKAAGAINAYGVSKAAMEQEAIAANSHALPRGTRIACTRWGNVLGSTGSVVQLWAAALRRGTPFLITDPDMTRFWLTLDHATELACWAVQAMRGGEVFVPELPAMRLGDLAEAFSPDHPRILIGTRPGGEKQHEILLTAEEQLRTVSATPDIWAINPSFHSWSVSAPWAGSVWPPDRIYRSDLTPALSIGQMQALLRLGGWIS